MKEPETLHLYVATGVPADALQQLLQAGSWVWLYAERPEGIILGYVEEALRADLPWSRWVTGRAFNKASELTWEQTAPGVYDICLLTTGAPAAGMDWNGPEIWQAYETKPTRTLLYGTEDSSQGQWWEARIPRLLRYPVPAGSQRVTLLTQTYSLSGVVGLTRLIAVEGLDG